MCSSSCTPQSLDQRKFEREKTGNKIGAHIYVTAGFDLWIEWSLSAVGSNESLQDFSHMYAKSYSSL